MQLHQIKPNHKQKKKKRVGRGGKRGTYSGRGMKGQKSRAGRRLMPQIREIIKRYPKLRGYRLRSSAQSSISKPVVFNLEILEKNFSSGEKITPTALFEKKLINKTKGRMPNVKILGEGKITKVFIIEDCLISKSAKEKVEKSGGKIL